MTLKYFSVCALFSFLLITLDLLWCILFYVDVPRKIVPEFLLRMKLNVTEKPHE